MGADGAAAAQACDGRRVGAKGAEVRNEREESDGAEEDERATLRLLDVVARAGWELRSRHRRPHAKAETNMVAAAVGSEGNSRYAQEVCLQRIVSGHWAGGDGRSSRAQDCGEARWQLDTKKFRIQFRIERCY